MSGKIASIKKGCRTCEKILSATIREFPEFETEKQAARFIEMQIGKRGLKKAFPVIVSCKKNARDIHHKPDSTKLRHGFVVIDFGVRVSGYCCDITRTIFLGRSAKKERRLYKKVLIAHKKTAKLAKPGVKARELYLAARSSLKPYERQFAHNAGHGLGKQIHVKPSLKRKSRDILRKGDVITIEPGIYKRGKYGIRIEDDYLITKKGAKRLSNISMRLVCISKKMG